MKRSILLIHVILLLSCFKSTDTPINIKPNKTATQTISRIYFIFILPRNIITRHVKKSMAAVEKFCENIRPTTRNTGSIMLIATFLNESRLSLCNVINLARNPTVAIFARSLVWKVKKPKEMTR